MVRIPGGDFVFKVRGTEIEGSDDDGVDVQYPWEDSPRRFHEHTMPIKPFFIDTYPVTNAHSNSFLTQPITRRRIRSIFCATGKTGDSRRDGTAGQSPGSRWKMRAPMRKWAGKRLPHEWEWQFAAQGTDGRLIHGAASGSFANVPSPDQGRSMRGPDPVDAHPLGASPYGVMDIVGNVWQWTDEFTDEHTRAAIVRGGELLPAARLYLVLSPGLSQRRTQQGATDGSELRPFRRRRISLRTRRASKQAHADRLRASYVASTLCNTLFSSVPIGSMVMRILSPLASVKVLGGTIPVPVIRKQPLRKRVIAK